VRFEGTDGEFRFVRRHEGQWVRYGRLYDEYAAVLTFADDEEAADDAQQLANDHPEGIIDYASARMDPAPVIRTDGYQPISNEELDELLAPVGWDVPPAGQDLDEVLEPVGYGKPTAAVTRIEFTPQQANVADRIERVVALTTGWGNDDEEARRKVQTDFLSSFRIEPLIVAAGRQEPLTWMRAFLGRIEDAAVISERGRVLELLDPAKAADQLEKLCGNAQDRFESWYKPNSTSNVDVEIKLAEHEAWQSLYRVATGKRFY
jgi:hypothetical protein